MIGNERFVFVCSRCSVGIIGSAVAGAWQIDVAIRIHGTKLALASGRPFGGCAESAAHAFAGFLGFAPRDLCPGKPPRYGTRAPYRFDTCLCAGGIRPARFVFENLKPATTHHIDPDFIGNVVVDFAVAVVVNTIAKFWGGRLSGRGLLTRYAGLRWRTGINAGVTADTFERGIVDFAFLADGGGCPLDGPRVINLFVAISVDSIAALLIDDYEVGAKAILTMVARATIVGGGAGLHFHVWAILADPAQSTLAGDRRAEAGADRSAVAGGNGQIIVDQSVAVVVQSIANFDAGGRTFVFTTVFGIAIVIDEAARAARHGTFP